MEGEFITFYGWPPSAMNPEYCLALAFSLCKRSTVPSHVLSSRCGDIEFPGPEVWRKLSCWGSGRSQNFPHSMLQPGRSYWQLASPGVMPASYQADKGKCWPAFQTSSWGRFAHLIPMSLDCASFSRTGPKLELNPNEIHHPRWERTNTPRKSPSRWPVETNK